MPREYNPYRDMLLCNEGPGIKGISLEGLAKDLAYLRSKDIIIAEVSAPKDKIDTMKDDIKFVKLPVLRRNVSLEVILEDLEEFDACICGGYARYCMSPRHDPPQAGDLDIYCSDKSSFDELLKFLKVEIGSNKTTKLSEIFITPQAKNKEYRLLPKIQLIKPSEWIVAVGTTEEILSHFDFTIAQAALVNVNYGIASKDFEYDELNKLLRISNIRCPLSQLLRIEKYRQKGYKLVPGEQIKIFDAWLKMTEERKQEYRDLAAKVPHDTSEWPESNELSEFRELIYIVD